MAYDRQEGDCLRTFWYADPKELNGAGGSDDPAQPTTPLRRINGDESLDTANLVASLDLLDEHRPVLDIDFDARLIPSSTPGHYHLYLDGIALSWPAYLEVLEVLAKHGIIQQGYLKHSKERRMTVVRRPHVKKPVAVIDDDEPF